VDWRASDSGDPAAVEKLFADLKNDYAELDGLFLKAGIARFIPWTDTPESEFDAHFNVNVKGPWLAVKHAAPLLKDGASVLITAAVVNIKGFAASSVYSATKAAVRSLVRVGAAEFAARKIRFNVVSPGPIETPIFGKMGAPEEQVKEMTAGFASMVPLGRMGTSEEVANAAAFLLSDRASFINGAELSVDGGLAQV